MAPPRASFSSTPSSGVSATVLNRYFSQPAPVQPGTAAPGSFVGGRLIAEARSISFIVVLAATQAEAHAAARKAARTTGACRDDDNKGSAQAHHIATNKNPLATDSGGPWTPKFEDLFKEVGMTLNDPANIINLLDHQGPHPEEYHKHIYTRLNLVFRQCTNFEDCKIRFIEALDELAAEICKPGSRLNILATKKK